MKPNRIKQEGCVTRVWFDDCKSGDTFPFLLSSDRHHDAVGCEREVETKHLEEAKRTGAMIIDAGDLFDAMQGKFDPRRSYSELRPEHRVKDYYGSIADAAVDFYMPYAGNFLVIGKGNHEGSVLDKTNLDLTSRLVYGLRRGNKDIQCGFYGGWIIMNFSAKGGGRCSFKYRYHHGSGGNAPVTKGIISTNRQAVYLPDADLVHNGHNHQAYALPIKRERISAQGKTYRDICWFVRTPGYKYEFEEGDSWASQKQFAPNPIGAVWMTLEYSGKGRGRQAHITCKLTPDIE